MTAYAYRVGRVQKPHGLGGDLLIKLFRPRRDRSNKRRPVKGEVRLALTADDDTEVEYRLEGVRFVDPTRVVIGLEGVDRTTAEGLVGRFVDLDPANLPAVLTDFADRAFDLEVVAEEAPVGRIIDIRDNGAQPLLIIETPDGGEVSVPYRDAFVAGVEGEGDARVLRLTPIPGLLDLD